MPRAIGPSGSYHQPGLEIEMSTQQWILAIFGASFVTAVIVGIIVSVNCNKKFQLIGSLNEALKSAQTALQAVKASIVASSAQLESSKEELSGVESRTGGLVKLEQRSKLIHNYIRDSVDKIESLKAEIVNKTQKAQAFEQTLHKLKSGVDLYSRIAEFVEYGLFEEPEYLHETSERYKAEIVRVRELQKKMIASKTAIELPGDILVEGSSEKGIAILAGQAKLMLKSFNIECDTLIQKVNPSNFAKTLARIEKVAETLEKAALSLKCGISPQYVELKFKECTLFYEYKLKKTNEQEEQRLIREQLREEQKAAQEYERTIAEAEREERLFEKLLQTARLELESANDAAKAALLAKVAALELQLAEAHTKEERARSMAEQTRRGHVYIISNIGSFGDQIYKIGLTRRLDPVDRVNELGDASVPFRFDIHAIIYSEDAPALEAALHRRFNRRRVNRVNLRKEFFHVSLEEIKVAVEELAGPDADFHMTALAEDFYESRRLLGAPPKAIEQSA